MPNQNAKIPPEVLNKLNQRIAAVADKLEARGIAGTQAEIETRLKAEIVATRTRGRRLYYGVLSDPDVLNAVKAAFPEFVAANPIPEFNPRCTRRDFS